MEVKQCDCCQSIFEKHTNESLQMVMLTHLDGSTPFTKTIDLCEKCTGTFNDNMKAMYEKENMKWK